MYMYRQEDRAVKMVMMMSDGCGDDDSHWDTFITGAGWCLDAAWRLMTTVITGHETSLACVLNERAGRPRAHGCFVCVCDSGCFNRAIRDWPQSVRA